MAHKAEILYDSIPVVDLADFTSGNPARKAKFVEELGMAFQNIGFVAVKNHGFTADRRERLYEVVKEFFALPDEVKMKYHKPELAGQRGYTPRNQEHAKDHPVPDLKEFYQIGQEDIRPEDNLPAEDYPPNIWPEELPEFKEETLHAFRTLEEAGRQLLRAIALYLGLEEDYFEDKVEKGNSILRTIHYYPIENPDALPPDSVRAAAHGDINLITLLMGASAEGLEVLRHDGKWIPAIPKEDEVVINVGDMLSRLTNNKLKSTIHRVVNPPREKMHEPRYSIPFFLHPRSEMSLACLESCIDEQNPKQYPDITAGEFLRQRLIEIGLLKK